MGRRPEKSKRSCFELVSVHVKTETKTILLTETWRLFRVASRELQQAAGMSRGGVTVEIFTAGDGINYPKKGQTVTIHYTGYVRPMRLPL